MNAFGGVKIKLLLITNRLNRQQRRKHRQKQNVGLVQRHCQAATTTTVSRKRKKQTNKQTNKQTKQIQNTSVFGPSGVVSKKRDALAEQTCRKNNIFR